MPGFKDIIKKERVDAMEERQRAVEHVVSKRLAAFQKEISDLWDAEELLHDKTTAMTWRGRFHRLVKWLK